MTISELESQQILMCIEGILADYDEEVSCADLLIIADRLDESYPALNFLIRCEDSTIRITYFDDGGHGKTETFTLESRIPVSSLKIN